MTKEEALLKDLVPSLSTTQLENLALYYELLKDEASKYNLTTITKYQEVYIKHYYDSLLLSKVVDLNNKTLLDIGTGAGFPGMVLSICFPNLKVTLVEATAKKCHFLNLVINTLHLTNVTVICERAEKLPKIKREQYDYVTARAVSNLSILAELLAPYAKINGYVITYKGINGINELNEAKHSLNVLALTLENKTELSLPFDFGQRIIMSFKKNKPTPSIYPRDYAKIKNKPL